MTETKRATKTPPPPPIEPGQCAICREKIKGAGYPWKTVKGVRQKACDPCYEDELRRSLRVVDAFAPSQRRKTKELK